MKTITGVKIGIAIGALMIINRYYSKRMRVVGKYYQSSRGTSDNEEYKDCKDCKDKK